MSDNQRVHKDEATTATRFRSGKSELEVRAATMASLREIVATKVSMQPLHN